MKKKNQKALKQCRETRVLIIINQIIFLIINIKVAQLLLTRLQEK